ncbi:CHASE3 domain-containing protein [Paenibacillus chitinolyticus]|uniref:CHASE3 domain-containing protein n=1 Tax=Paenibacillus chitinolyticus TaxID=79263 RepID=UPI0035203B30
MLRARRFSIRWKIMSGYLLILVCLAASIFAVNGRIVSLQKEIDFVTEHDIQVHDLTSEVEKQLLDMETGQRGYVITGDDRYLEPYEKAQANWLTDYDTLHGLVADNPSQQKRLEELRSVIEKWIAEAGQPVIAWKKAGNTPQIQQYFQEDPGKKYMDRIRVMIDTFRSTETKLTLDRVANLDERNKDMRSALYLMMLGVAIVAVATAILISRSIQGTISKVIRAINHLASSDGDLSERIEVKSRDEIRDLGDATNRLLDNVQRETEEKTQVAELTTALQGFTDTAALSDMFVRKAAELFNAPYGVVYMLQTVDGEYGLHRMAAYASDGGNEERSRMFKPGEGLVGQCAEENRMLTVDHLPENYVTVRSGLGEASPRHILIAPASFKGSVTAVVEFASFEPFTASQRQVLRELLTSFGIILNSVGSRMEVERLLQESRVMAEELQVQSEELRTQTEEMQVTNEELEAQYRVSEQKTLELEQASLELQAKAEQVQLASQYKSEFLANMSHELRTPLNSMLLLSQFLAENQNNTLSEEELDYVELIHKAGNDLLALINDVLDLSKVEAGKLEVNYEPFNLTELPDKMEHLFGKMLKDKDVAFKRTMEPGLPEIIQTDGQRLEQIVKNLLSNAVKFTHYGEVTLSLRRAKEEEENHLLPGLDWTTALAISVRDTGIGIPKDKQEHVFEAFRQADGATSRQYGGTGLGLSISRDLAGLLNGCIHLASEEGAGSTFTLYICCLDRADTAGMEAASALEAEASALPAPAKPKREAAGRTGTIIAGKTVLIVDDDPRNVTALSVALESRGMRVLTAGDGIECLALMDHTPDIDVVLMDIMMPGMDGYEAMTRIRERAEWADLPLIAVTAKAMKNDRDKCIEAGASDYISKPVDLNQLISLLNVWLNEN